MQALADMRSLNFSAAQRPIVSASWLSIM